MTENKKPRGFALLSPEKRKAMASRAGKASQAKGKAYRLTSEKAREAGKKGGAKVRDLRGKEFFAQIGKKGGEMTSQDREHMSMIGKKGGKKVSQDRKHMAEIGKRGGKK
jgi:general stress protein YciG